MIYKTIYRSNTSLKWL